MDTQEFREQWDSVSEWIEQIYNELFAEFEGKESNNVEDVHQ
jgi:hypothetical protein